MHDCVKFHGKVFSCALVYAPNSIRQCLLESMVVPVMSVRRDVVEDMPPFIWGVLSQKTVFSTIREIILVGGFL